MKIYSILLILCLTVISNACAQDGPSGKTLASSMDVYVFPKEGQQPDQQSKDEAACYEWAVNNSGNDPFALQKQSVAQAEQTEQSKAAAQESVKGSGAQGALRGAAAGVVVGAIADDVGKGAAYGAAAGGIVSRRRAKKGAKQATSQAEQQGQMQQQATQEQLGNFKKAFSVCLEAKEYLVKH